MEQVIEIVESTLLSDDWYRLSKVTYRQQKQDGGWQIQSREVYDRGNGAAILLYDDQRRTVVLTRQFRLPSYLNGNPSGMLIEVCAGLLDGDDPEDCIRREVEEEAGYRITEARKVMEVYMSPGAVTEIVHCFVGRYARADKVEQGGGLEQEGEHIEVLELPFDEAFAMIGDGRIRDGKTIMLLQYAKLQQLV
jgi:GDP-mannose pyrophosphatase NudK